MEVRWQRSSLDCGNQVGCVAGGYCAEVAFDAANLQYLRRSWKNEYPAMKKFYATIAGAVEIAVIKRRKLKCLR